MVPYLVFEFKIPAIHGAVSKADQIAALQAQHRAGLGRRGDLMAEFGQDGADLADLLGIRARELAPADVE